MRAFCTFRNSRVLPYFQGTSLAQHTTHTTLLLSGDSIRVSRAQCGLERHRNGTAAMQSQVVVASCSSDSNLVAWCGAGRAPGVRKGRGTREGVACCAATRSTAPRTTSPY